MHLMQDSWKFGKHKLGFCFENNNNNDSIQKKENHNFREMSKFYSVSLLILDVQLFNDGIVEVWTLGRRDSVSQKKVSCVQSGAVTGVTQD